MRRHLFSFALSLSLLAGFAQATWAEPQKGTIRMRDGRVFDDVLYEIRGQKVWVKRPYGEVTYDMAKISAIEPNEDEGPEVGAAEIDRPGADWLARFQLEPPPQWKVVTPSMPGVLAQLRHSSRDAVFMVQVFPIEKPFVFDRGEERKVLERVREDLGRMFARESGSRLKVGTLHECPVYHLRGAKVRPHGVERGESEKIVHEMRFQRLGLEYALTYVVDSADEGALEHDVEGVFSSFSFLPALVIEDTLYADLTRGFAISTLPEWKKVVRPFDTKRPLSLENEDGRASVDIEVLIARDAERTVRDLISKRGETSKVVIEPATLSGAEVVKFSFNGFRKGGRSLLGFRGYAAATDGQIVVLTGVAPLSDSDSKKLVAEVDSMLASFRARDVERLTKGARQAKAAFELLAQGSEALARKRPAEAIQRLSEAIQTDPKFALAYYLRGLAKKADNDFEGYKLDLTKAGELSPGSGYTAPLAGALADEAATAHKQKLWTQSMELHGKLLKEGEGNAADARKKLVECAKGMYGAMRRSKNYSGWKEIDEGLRSYKDAPDVQEALLKVLMDCARDLGAKGKTSDAKRCLRAAKKALRNLRGEKSYKQSKTAFERIEDSVQKGRR